MPVLRCSLVLVDTVFHGGMTWDGRMVALGRYTLSLLEKVCEDGMESMAVYRHQYVKDFATGVYRSAIAGHVANVGPSGSNANNQRSKLALSPISP